MNLLENINEFLNNCEIERKIDLNNYKYSRNDDIDTIGKIFSDQVISLPQKRNLDFDTSNKLCQAEKIGYTNCNNTSSFSINNNNTCLCWKHSYLFSQELIN
jgi:hypothetical protein